MIKAGPVLPLLFLIGFFVVLWPVAALAGVGEIIYELKQIRENLIKSNVHPKQIEGINNLIKELDVLYGEGIGLSLESLNVDYLKKRLAGLDELINDLNERRGLVRGKDARATQSFHQMLSYAEEEKEAVKKIKQMVEEGKSQKEIREYINRRQKAIADQEPIVEERVKHYRNLRDNLKFEEEAKRRANRSPQSPQTQLSKEPMKQRLRRLKEQPKSKPPGNQNGKIGSWLFNLLTLGGGTVKDIATGKFRKEHIYGFWDVKITQIKKELPAIRPGIDETQSRIEELEFKLDNGIYFPEEKGSLEDELGQRKRQLFNLEARRLKLLNELERLERIGEEKGFESSYDLLHPPAKKGAEAIKQASK